MCHTFIPLDQMHMSGQLHAPVPLLLPEQEDFWVSLYIRTIHGKQKYPAHTRNRATILRPSRIVTVPSTTSQLTAQNKEIKAQMPGKNYGAYFFFVQRVYNTTARSVEQLTGSAKATRSLSFPEMHKVPLSSPRSAQSLFLITSFNDSLTCKH